MSYHAPEWWMDPTPWMEYALCAQTDPEEFFPEKGGSTRAARRVCESCPVRWDCLAWSLDARERYGIWGGATERDRRRMIRKRDERAKLRGVA